MIYRLLVLVILLVPVAAHAQAPAPSDTNYWAVCRMTSHGASCTVIWTGPGKTYLLGCGHAYEGKDRNKRMNLDVPRPSTSTPKMSIIRLIAVDYLADLSLVEVDDGPFPYCAPVAPLGYALSRRIYSCGYDEMQYPPQQRPATVLRTSIALGTTFTRERPWHGRSGGGLIDLQAGYLVGVCSGYTGPRDHRETRPGEAGVYVSLVAIQTFLVGRVPATGQPVGIAPLPPRQPIVTENPAPHAAPRATPPWTPRATPRPLQYGPPPGC